MSTAADAGEHARAAVGLAESATGEPVTISAMRISKAPSVGGHVADPDPVGSCPRRILLRDDPLRPDPHQDERGTRPRGGVRNANRGVRGRRAAPRTSAVTATASRADEDDRAEHVEEERELPAVGSDRSERLRLPACRSSGRGPRRTATVDAMLIDIAPRSRAAPSTRAGSARPPPPRGAGRAAGLVASARRAPRAPREHPEQERGDDPPVADVYSSTSITSQIPKTSSRRPDQRHGDRGGTTGSSSSDLARALGVPPRSRAPRRRPPRRGRTRR